MWAAPQLLSPSDPPRSRQSIGSQRKRCNRTMLKKERFHYFVTWLQWEGSTCLFPGRTTHVKFRVITPVPHEAPAFYTWYWCFTLNYFACQVNWGRWPRSKEGIDMSWWWVACKVARRPRRCTPGVARHRWARLSLFIYSVSGAKVKIDFELIEGYSLNWYSWVIPIWWTAFQNGCPGDQTDQFKMSPGDQNKRCIKIHRISKKVDLWFRV